MIPGTETSGLTGQLTVKVAPKERRAKRTPVALDAGLRQRGAGGVTVEILDLSTHGFRARTHLALAPGTDVWLKLPGLETLHGRVAWMQGTLIGCAFAQPLHPAVLEMIVRRPS
jgi:hypothetical protein